MKRHGVTSLLIVNKEKNRELVGMLDIRMMVFFLAWGKYQSMQNGEGPRFSQDVDYAAAKVTDSECSGGVLQGRSPRRGRGR